MLGATALDVDAGRNRHRASSKAQRLKDEAAEAAEIREALEDPNVVALMVERVRRIGETFIWAAIGIFAVFTIITVHQFVARHAEIHSLEWFGAWFLEPGFISGLLGILIWEGVTSKWRVTPGPWMRIAKWGFLLFTLTMNIWLAVATHDFGGVWAHTAPPVGIVLLTEARIEGLDKLAECVQRAHASAARRREERIAERTRLAREAAETRDTERTDRLADAQTDANIQVLRSTTNVTVAENAAAAAAARTGPMVFGQTGPDRSGQPGSDLSAVTSQTGPGDESRPVLGMSPDRSGTVTQTGPNHTPDSVPDRPRARTQTGSARRPGTSQKSVAGRSGTKPTPRQRTDDDLLKDVRGLVGENGEPPTKYQLKQALGIGNDRAARLLEQLDPVPAGAPSSNGAATAAGAGGH